MASLLVTETRFQGNEIPNTDLTIAMLYAMRQALDEMDMDSRIAHARPAKRDTNSGFFKPVVKGYIARRWKADKLRDREQCALPLEYLEHDSEPQFIDLAPFAEKLAKADTEKKRNFWDVMLAQAEKLNACATKQDVYALMPEPVSDNKFMREQLGKLKAQRLAQVANEHVSIMQPDFKNLEGIFAIVDHLGENKQPKPFLVNGVRHMSGATGLSSLDKIIYNEAGVTAQGEAVLPHLVKSQREWFRHAGGIMKKFACTREQAETLALAFRILDTTPEMAKEFAKWLSIKGKFDKGYVWFQNIAKELVLVTDEGEPKIIDLAEQYCEDVAEDELPIDCDNPADIVEIQAEGWHKLDDPRENVPSWESRQPKEFKQVLATIRTAKDFQSLKAFGKKLFNDKRFDKNQTSVIWDVYRENKHRLAPKLRKTALTALNRLADKTVNLNKVANWLHGDGKAVLNEYELSVLWATWKKCKGAYAPKRESSPMEQVNITYCPVDFEGYDDIDLI